MELANDASYTVLHVPDEGGRVSLGGEDIGSHDARVVDTELDGLDADFVLSKRNEAGTPSHHPMDLERFRDTPFSFSLSVHPEAKHMVQHIVSPR